MNIKLWPAGLALAACAFGAEAPVTFHKDVLPILQRNCQTCHRPGNIAPMSFLTYESTRPWAKAMKTAVVSFIPHRPNVSYNTLLWVDKQRDEEGVEGTPTERRRAIPTPDGKGVDLPARARTSPQPGADGVAQLGLAFTCYVPGRALSDFR